MRKLILATILAFFTLSVTYADPTPTGSPIQAGLGYYAILPNKILLASKISPDCTSIRWTMVSGPGPVSIEKPDSAITWATAKEPGKYVFKITASGKISGEEIVSVNVYPAGS